MACVDMRRSAFLVHSEGGRRYGLGERGLPMAGGAQDDPGDPGAVRWMPLAGTHGFELRQADDSRGTMRWASRLGSRATAEIDGRSFSLKRVGFLSPIVVVREGGTDTEVARLYAHGARSRIEVTGGPNYDLRRAGMLVPAWTVTAAGGAPGLNIEPVEERGRLEGALVVVEAALQAAPELPVLLALSWYFIVQAWFEEVAVLAGGAALRAASDP